MRLASTAALAALAATLTSVPAFAQQTTQDPSAAPGGVYQLDKGHASVTLKLSHMGLSYYTMRFDKIDANYSYDPANPAGSRIQVAIDPASIDTDAPAFNQEIADQLHVSVEAVKAHLRKLFEKFGVGELAQTKKRIRLAELALISGAVSPRAPG